MGRKAGLAAPNNRTTSNLAANTKSFVFASESNNSMPLPSNDPDDAEYLHQQQQRQAAASAAQGPSSFAGLSTLIGGGGKKGPQLLSLLLEKQGGGGKLGSSRLGGDQQVKAALAQLQDAAAAQKVQR
jgi:hypothetical protein